MSDLKHECIYVSFITKYNLQKWMLNLLTKFSHTALRNPFSFFFHYLHYIYFKACYTQVNTASTNAINIPVDSFIFSTLFPS
jgi:hypothetical protein